jgi:glucan phosphoethanolaminetransferase (alkaline phosphatase superfamily)
MRKLILSFTLILSFIAMMSVTLFFGQLFDIIKNVGLIGNIDIDLETLTALFETNIEEALYLVGLLSWIIVQLYGIPLIIFLVSLNGLKQK